MSKTIIIGSSGCGKSCKALEMAIKNKGTTIIVNGCATLSDYIKDLVEWKKLTQFSPLRSFIPQNDKKNASFAIQNGKKYFIENIRGVRPHGADYIRFVNGLLLDSRDNIANLRNDKEAMVIFDDDAWLFENNEMPTILKKSVDDNIMLRLKQFAQVDCQIVITAQSWEDLLQVIEVTEQMKEDVRKMWNVEELGS